MQQMHQNSSLTVIALIVVALIIVAPYLFSLMSLPSMSLPSLSSPSLSLPVFSLLSLLPSLLWQPSLVIPTSSLHCLRCPHSQCSRCYHPHCHGPHSGCCSLPSVVIPTLLLPSLDCHHHTESHSPKAKNSLKKSSIANKGLGIFLKTMGQHKIGWQETL